MTKFAIIAFLSLAGKSIFAASRIVVDAPVVDLGAVDPGVPVVREVAVSNSGDAVLSVSRVRACCGANATMEGMKIAPGESSVLRVELNPGAVPGPFRKTVTVYSDDPQNPVMMLPLTGSVKPFEPKEDGGSVVLASGPAESSPALDCTPIVVMFAGLVDGFNPCAFSIVIALAGILAVGGRRRHAS